MFRYASASRPALLVLAITSIVARAQDFRAAVTGRITDSSGAAVADAKISATNAENGAVTTTQSSSSGDYLLPSLTPGSYRLEAQLTGFKRYVRTGILLQVQDRPAIDITLEPGDQATSITVSADVALLETSNASRGSVISGRTLVDLPLNGRNAFALAALEPGVSFTARGQANTFFRTTANGGISSASFSGGQLRSNESLLDGVPNTGTDGLVQYIPSVDAAQEFRVQTNVFDSEYGRFTGGVINAAIRSGTNDLHGTLFHFVRNSYWNARDPFATSIPQFGYNLFGGSVGGPVRIPKVYNGRNRTFWFFNYEGSREGVPRANVSTVPTAAQRQGDFSQTRVRSGAQVLPVSVYDPLTTQAAGGAFTRTQFPDNRIPANRINSIARRVLELYPQPNAPGDPVTGANNFLLSFKDPVSDNGYVMKVDHRFSDRHSIFGRYSFRRFNVGRQGAFRNEVTGDAEQRDAPGFAFDDTFVINPSTVFNFRYGLNRFKTASAADSVGIDMVALGFSSAYAGLLPVQAIPQIGISNGFTGLSGANKLNRGAEDGHTFRASISKVVGRQSLKFGGEFRLYNSNSGNLGAAAAGAFNFDQVFTRGPNPQVAAVNAGFGLASFLLGLPASGSVATTVSSADRTTYYGGFLQDDIRLNSRLTINLGLRYEIEGPYYERYNRLNRGFDFETASPIADRARANYAVSPIPEIQASQFRVNGGLLFAGINGAPRGISDIDRNNVAPRIGFAYQLTGGTVLRGGYGLFYGASTQTGETRNGFSVTTPYVASNDGGLTPANNLTDPFPSGLSPASGSADGLLTLAGQGVGYTFVDRRQPMASQFSFGVQQKLPKDVLFEISYVGSRIEDLPVTQQFNAIPEAFRANAEGVFQATQRNILNDSVANPFFGLIASGPLAARTTTRGQLLRPYPQFTSISASSVPTGSSQYDALQTKVIKRFSAGFSFTGSYSFSKQLERTRFLNDQDTELTRELNEFDAPHRFVVSSAYELPIGPGKWLLGKSTGLVGRVLGGFQVNVIYQAQSGFPLEVSGAETTGVSARLPGEERTVARWFDTTAFRLRQPLELTRTARLAGVRSPGRSNTDLSLFRNIPITDRVRLQFRAEAFNALNRPEFSSPGTTFGSANFGVTTSTNTFARQLQFALKLLW